MSLNLSRSMPRRATSAIVILLAFALAGCASRPGPEVLQPVASAPGSREIQIYVATTRDRATPSQNIFTAKRADELNFAKFVVAVPPVHQPGNIAWPTGTPDSRVSFATTNQVVLNSVEFRDAVASPGKLPRRGKKHDVLIFVHGFNTNFQESLFRLAQISVDSGFTGVPVLFAWPSQAEPVRYRADQDAAAFSRSYFKELLRIVTSSPQVGEIVVLAHSMGGMLVAESLRELRVQHEDRVIARLGRVILAAPDIDVAVFQSQVQAIGPLNPPLTVLVSTDDRALRLSSFIGGSQVRAGALDVDNPLVRDAALKAKVRIVDISKIRSVPRGMNHGRIFELVAFYPKLQSQPAAQRQVAGAFLFDPSKLKQIQAEKNMPAQ
jgi:esterase/lipase superfamily enzyme